MCGTAAAAPGSEPHLQPGTASGRARYLPRSLPGPSHPLLAPPPPQRWLGGARVGAGAVGSGSGSGRGLCGGPGNPGEGPTPASGPAPGLPGSREVGGRERAAASAFRGGDGGDRLSRPSGLVLPRLCPRCPRGSQRPAVPGGGWVRGRGVWVLPRAVSSRAPSPFRALPPAPQRWSGSTGSRCLCPCATAGSDTEDPRPVWPPSLPAPQHRELCMLRAPDPLDSGLIIAARA